MAGKFARKGAFWFF